MTTTDRTDHLRPAPRPRRWRDAELDRLVGMIRRLERTRFAPVALDPAEALELAEHYGRIAGAEAAKGNATGARYCARLAATAARFAPIA